MDRNSRNERTCQGKCRFSVLATGNTRRWDRAVALSPALINRAFLCQLSLSVKRFFGFPDYFLYLCPVQEESCWCLSTNMNTQTGGEGGAPVCLYLRARNCPALSSTDLCRRPWFLHTAWDLDLGLVTMKNEAHLVLPGVGQSGLALSHR